MSDDEKVRTARFEKFLRFFEAIEKNTAASTKAVEKLTAAIAQNAEINSALFEAITKDKDGLICAIDDLLVEINGLREDLREFAKVGGVQMALGSILRGRRRV